MVIALYLGAMAAMGLVFARRNKTTEDYFVGSRAFPGWVIGLSMLSTSISSVTFLAFPANAFKSDWRNLVMNLTLPLVAIVAVVVFIPFFRRGNLTSAFEYLGQRFGPFARLYGTVSFIFLQLLRLATVLFLVAIPIHLVTGAPMPMAIVITGIFVALYTVIGGIEAVIWTDVVQSFVLWFGGLICLICIVVALPGGMGQIFEVGTLHEKFYLGGLDFNLGEGTFWTLALLGIFEWLGMFCKDQNVVQRYVSAKSTREARKATILFALIAVPTWVFFFFLGTSVFVYYLAFPDPVVATLKPEAVLPHFILHQLPVGIAGLVLAGVLAAAMSSLDSSINAIATITTIDLLKPFLAKGRTDRFYLRSARIVACGAAVLMIVGAVLFTRIERTSINDLTWAIASIFGGCLVGLFLLGFFARRVDRFAVTISLIVAVVFNVYLGLSLSGHLPAAITINVHKLSIGPLVNLLFILLAYVISLVRRPTPQSLDGLTVWTLNHEDER